MQTGEKIRKLRELKGLTQENMGQLLGMTQQVYSRLESGKTRLTIDALQAIADALNLEVMRIIEFDDAPIFNSNHQQGGQANNYFQSGGTSHTELLNRVNELLTENINLKDEVIELKAQIRSHQINQIGLK
jgi:transcriptional regulator with XRE-family HTH domain